MKVRQLCMLDKNKKYMGYCPEEQEVVPGYIVDGETEHIVAGVKVTAPSFHLVCKKCGAWLSSNEVERENDISIYDAYKKKVGLLTTYEIKEIRTKRGMSQRQLAKFLDIGEKDITRYENGSVQTRSIDNMIRLVGDDTAYKSMCKCLNKNANSKK